MAKQQPRGKDPWVQKLNRPGPEREKALADLGGILVRGLGDALAQYARVTKADLENFAQEALLKILAALDSFPGESRFTTWAFNIAVHTAFAELRRRRWSGVSLEEVTVPPDAQDGSAGYLPNTLADPSAGTKQQAVQREVLGVMRDVVMKELTDRQRKALVAVHFHGMPIAEVTHRMHTPPNALYKLLLDTRKQLQSRILARGLSQDEILNAFDV